MTFHMKNGRLLKSEYVDAEKLCIIVEE